MPDIFGFSGGLQQANQDADRHMLAVAGVEDTASQIAARRLGMQETQVKVDTAKLALQNQQKFAQAMSQVHSGQGAAGGGSDSVANHTEQLASQFADAAQLSLESGLVEQGKDMATAASSLRRSQSQIDKVQYDKGMRNIKLIEKLLPNVHDQYSWQQANFIFQMETGEKSPFANVPFSPQLMQQLQSSLQTSKEKAETLRAQAQARDADAAATEHKFRTDHLLPAQEKYNTARAAALTKAGRKDLIPKAGEIKVITDMMVQEFDIDPQDGTAMAGARHSAWPIAERMKDIMAANPGMPVSEASKKAFTEAKKAGDFAGLDRNKAQPGASPKSAIDLPKDKAKLKDNHWYMIKGKPMLLDGKQFYSEDEVKANAQDQMTADEGDDDDEEGDE